MQVREINKKKFNTLDQVKTDELIKKMRKESEKLVKGKFEFLDAKGGWFEFAYRIFKGEPILIMKIIHGEVCELPMGIVKHLNNTKRKIRRMVHDLDRSTTKSIIEDTQSRVRFTPVDVF